MALRLPFFFFFSMEIQKPEMLAGRSPSPGVPAAMPCHKGAVQKKMAGGEREEVPDTEERGRGSFGRWQQASVCLPFLLFCHDGWQMKIPAAPGRAPELSLFFRLWAALPSSSVTLQKCQQSVCVCVRASSQKGKNQKAFVEKGRTVVSCLSILPRPKVEGMDGTERMVGIPSIRDPNPTIR